MAYVTQSTVGAELNRPYEEDLPIHEWYRFVLSYPPHLVRDYIAEFELNKDDLILDPFCGTGTTLVESKKLGIPSIGLEANPVVHFAATTKIDWSGDPEELENDAEAIASEVLLRLESEGIPDDSFFYPLDSKYPEKLKRISPEESKLLIKDSISPLPLHKSIVLRDSLNEDSSIFKYEKIALAKHLVYTISNLRFGPEVGIGPIKKDSPVVTPWLAEVKSIADDLREFRIKNFTPSKVLLGDARNLCDKIKPRSISAVITSPPYPNEKDYSRTTRLESVLLGYMKNSEDLKRFKQTFLCSNTRNVYKRLTEDAEYGKTFPRVALLANQIDKRREVLEKTSGFEKLYGEVVRRYFGGMAKHLEELKPFLRPGAYLAYVVGDQASYFRILIRTGEILAEIAVRLGYSVERIDLFRTRAATATRDKLREEVVILRWNG